MLKNKIHDFFTKNKFGIWLFASMAILNSIEGIIHLVVASVGTFGVFKIFGWDTITNMLFIEGINKALMTWAVMLPNIENFVFGIFSIAVGFALGIAHHHHHH